MKTTLKLAFAAIVGATFIASVHAADYTMRLSHQLPPTHHVAKAIEQFAADVEANSGGKVKVQIFGAEQLFKADQNHAAVARGQVEAASVVSLQWGGTVPEMQALSIPYLLTDPDKLARFPESEAAQLLDRKLAERGVRNIAWLVDANDAVFTSARTPLVAPEDFRGVKIRGLSRLVDTGLIAMGAAPSTMPGSEVYQGLQTGVIDAGITSVGAAYSRRFYEVQKFAVATPLFTVYQNLIVNPRWWDGLPEDAREAIRAAARKAEQTLLPKSDEVNPDGVARLRDVGMTVIVHTPEQARALEEAMQPAVIEAFSKATPDAVKLIELIRAL